MEKSYRCGCGLENVFNKLFIMSFKEMLSVNIIVGRKESAKIMIVIK
jgi:hypothetical protein